MTSWFGRDDGPPIIDCPVCRHRRCLVCGADPYHEGAECPPARDDSVSPGSSSLAEDEETTLKFIASSNIRRCKRCNTGIIKEVGCHKVLLTINLP